MLDNDNGEVQKHVQIAYQPLITIIMPIYNSDQGWLRTAIDSVVIQTYLNWELCIIDGSNSNSDMKELLQEYRASDRRIRVLNINENVHIKMGISGSLNVALLSATGEYIGLLEQHDQLSPEALHEIVRRLNSDHEIDLIYTDEDKISASEVFEDPHCKPDYSPDLLLSMNYINHFCLYRKTILDEIEGFHIGYERHRNHDLLLRFTEKTSNVAHIDKVLYHSRKVSGSEETLIHQEFCEDTAGINVLKDTLVRRGLEGQVNAIYPGRYHVQYHIEDNPLVTIIIPIRDKVELLKVCLDSIYEKSTYSNIEIIIVNNGSCEQETIDYLNEMKLTGRCIVIDSEIPFNYSQLNNMAVDVSSGQYLLFLNNDTEVIAANWIEEMLGYCQRKHVGIVGAKLLFPDDTIQHAGVLIGNGNAWHALYQLKDEFKSNELLFVTRNCSAVTGACLMISKLLFDEVGGFDENLDVVYNDVDLCLKVMEQGYMNVFNPQALLYHHESVTRGKSHPKHNVDYFGAKWGEVLSEGDKYNVWEGQNKYEICHNIKNYGDNREIFIWGAGSSGKHMYQMLRKVSLSIEGFIDGAPEKWNSKLFQLPINSPLICEIPLGVKKPYIIIGSMYATEIAEMLESWGYVKDQDYWRSQ